MTNKATRSMIDTDAADNPAVATFEAWININRPMLAALSDLNGRFIEQMSRANKEWLSFLNRRLNEDIATSRQLLECKSVQELFQAYSEFASRAQKQYQAELQYFTELNQKLADDTASIVRNRVEQATSELRH